MQAIILNYLMHRPIKDLTHSHVQQATPIRRKTLCSTPHRPHTNYCIAVCVKGMKYLSNYSLLLRIYGPVLDEVILLLKKSIESLWRKTEVLKNWVSPSGLEIFGKPQ